MINNVLLVLGVLVCTIFFRETYIRYAALMDKKRCLKHKLYKESNEYKKAKRKCKNYKDAKSLMYYSDVASKYQSIIKVHRKSYNKLNKEIRVKKFIMGLCFSNCVLCILYFI